MKPGNNPKNKLQCANSNKWGYLSLAGIFFCLVIFLMQWRQLPFFLDMYYHAGVARGFQVAGKVVTYNFWEYGPAGAPHIYPPLVHIIMALLLNIGLTPVTMLRLFSVAIPIMVVFVLFYVVSKLFSKRVGFLTVYISLSVSIFTIALSFTPAASLGLILLLLGYYFLTKNRLIVPIILFGLLYYTHTGMAVLSLVLLLCMKTANIINLKNFTKTLFASVLIGLPWTFHIIRNIRLIELRNSAQMPLRFYPILIILFLIGLIISIRNTKRYISVLLLFISFIPMAWFYPFRYFCAQGMIGYIILAAIGLEKILIKTYQYLSKNFVLQKYRIFAVSTILLYVFFATPSITFHQKNCSFKQSDSLLSSIFEGKQKNDKNILSTGFYDDRVFAELAEYVEIYSEKGGFIWSNYRYAAGILWSITQRPTLTHMLLEVEPKNNRINIEDAAILIIFDDPAGISKHINDSLKNTFKKIKSIKYKEIKIDILINKRKSLL